MLNDRLESQTHLALNCAYSHSVRMDKTWLMGAISGTYSLFVIMHAISKERIFLFIPACVCVCEALCTLLFFGCA